MSRAITAADPLRNVKGDADMRPYLMGTRSGMRVRSWAASTFRGSNLRGGGVKPASDERGVTFRSARPAARRSSGLGGV
jgi:hypothetical protein